MSEITETCPHCYGTGWWGDNGKNVCPHCDGEGEVSANPPTCKSCGKTLHGHIGHEGLCRQLELAKEHLENLALCGYEDFGVSWVNLQADKEDVLKARAFLKELES